MPTAFDRLVQEAMELSPRQKLALATLLIESADAEVDPGAEAAWEVEIGNRLRAVDDGTEVGVLYEDVMREAADHLRPRRSDVE